MVPRPRRRRRAARGPPRRARLSGWCALTSRARAAAALLAVALALTLADGAAHAFASAWTDGRAVAASVVGQGNAYVGIRTVTFDAVSTLGFADKAAVHVWNNGTVALGVEWNETSDPSNLVTSTDCAGTVAVGGSCAILFTAAALPSCVTTCPYSVKGLVWAHAATHERADVRDVTVTVRYCPTGICG